MKYVYLLIITLISSFCNASAQTSSATVQQQMFDESQYTQVSQGFDPEFGGKIYTVGYKSTQDSAYTMKILYRGSTATSPLIEKRFYKAGVLNGPFTHYEGGVMDVKGTYTNGWLNGDRTTYQNGVVIQEAHFVSGRKTGSWKEYGQQGQLARTVTYDGQENIQSVQIASQTATSATPTTAPATQQGTVNQ